MSTLDPATQQRMLEAHQWLEAELRKSARDMKEAHLRVLQYRRDCLVRAMKHTLLPRVKRKQAKNLARIEHNIAQAVKELMK